MTASVSERTVLGASQALGDESSRRLCRSLGWVEQGAVFTIAAPWRNADLTDLELVRLARPESMSELRADLADVFGGSLEQGQADAFAAASAAVVFRLAAHDRFDLLRHAAIWDDATRRFNHVSIEERNARALATLPSDADAVLPWGAGHLPELATALKETDHRRTGTTWVDVPACLGSGQAPELSSRLPRSLC